MKKAGNIVYLYSEVMPYAISVMRALVNEYNITVDCIHWDNHKKTPYEPVNESGITFYRRSSFNQNSIIAFIEEREPLLIYISGRMDKLYLHAALHFRKKYKIVSGSDNQWAGSLKQWLSAIFSYFIYRRYFDYFWVPGGRQYEFARKMGYAPEKIISNLYTGDTAIFEKEFAVNRKYKDEKYPHTIVFVGRFAKVKGLDILVDAFTNAKNELDNDWRLILVGAGEISIGPNPYTELKGFMPGAELAKESKDWGVFCLPSLHEPWGVVVHEFGMLGLPFICSDEVGAADEFVINGLNGLIFTSGDTNALKKAIVSIMRKSDNELLAMGDKSYELSKKRSPSISAASLVHIITQTKFSV